MQLIVLTSDASLYAIRRITTEAESLAIPLQIINPFESIVDNFQYKMLKNNMVLHRTSGRLFNDIDLHYSKKLELAGATIINPLKELYTFRDKGHQMLHFLENKITYVPTIMTSGRPSPSLLSEIGEKFSPYNKQCEYIFKTVRGSQGVGVMLLLGEQSLSSVLEAHWALGDQRFLIQPYLKDAREFRLFFIKDSIQIFTEKIKDKNDFRGNSGRSRSVLLSKEKIPENVIESFNRALQTCNLHYGAIDLLLHEGTPYLLEMNATPGFKELEKICGQNIAQTLLKSMIKERN